MAKKKQVTTYEDKDIIDLNLEDLMGERFGRYSKYIIQERALPDARDGLKPVQRRIVYAMNKEGNTYDKAYRKSAKTVGLVIGNYHPHGDTSVYDAMVRMSQSWKLNYPLIDMHGNNGSIDNDSPAAMRYTEARLSTLANLLVKDLPYDTIPWQPNFDDSELEPIVLPTRVPLLLLQGSVGIAAGYATNIPPFNLTEVMNAVIHKVQKPKATKEDIFQIIQGPDFPTGGIICGKEDIINAMSSGQGKIKVRSKVQITKNEIVVTEIPYEVVKQDLVNEINTIRLDKEIDNITDVRDESDQKGLRIVIELKEGSNAEQTLNYLYKKTKLQTNCNFNMVAIVNHTPKQIGVIDAIDEFINFRQEVITKRSNYLLKKHNARLEIIDGLIKATSIMDKIIKVIKASKDKKDVINNLKTKFSFTDTQAEAIANMRLYRLSNTDIVELNKEKTLLTKEVTKLNKILSSDRELDKIIIKECNEVLTEFNAPRRTQIKDAIKEVTIDKRELVADEINYITVSKDGYIKRVSKRSYTSSNGDTGTKDGDSIIKVIECSTLTSILLLTNKGDYALIPAFELDEGKWKDIGSNLSKYVKSYNGSIINAFAIEDPKLYILSITKKGMAKKTPLKDLCMPTRINKAPTNMKVDNDDIIIYTNICSNDNDIFMITKNGLCNMYSIKAIPSTGIKGKGVLSNKLNNDDYNCIAQLLPANDEDKTSLMENIERISLDVYIKDNNITSKGDIKKAQKVLKGHMDELGGNLEVLRNKRGNKGKKLY